MIDLSKFEKPYIIICPQNIKDVLIKSKSQYNVSLNIKFITKQELIKSTSFTYDYETLLYVSKKYNYSFENTEEVLKNLKTNSTYNKKLAQLSLILEDLKKHNLIKENKLFAKLFAHKNCYIYGYSTKDNELKKVLENLGVSYSYLNDKTQLHQHVVYKFEDMELEVNNLFIEIMKLIDKGVSLNAIYLYDYPTDYELILKKYAQYHNLPIELKVDYCLYESPLYQTFLTYLKTDDVESACQKLKKEINLDRFDVINKIITVISEISYLNLEKTEFIELLNYIAKKTNLKRIKYKESIKVCDATSMINDDEYVFMLGFSLGSYPLIYKDTDFYADEEKIELGLNTSKIKTEIASEQLENFILRTKNLYISYKEKLNKTVFYKSMLIAKLALEVKNGKIYDERYSNLLSEIEVANYIDFYHTYGSNNVYLKTYTEDNLNYKVFDHRFKDISDFTIDYLSLSATAINEYNKCAFQYFVKRILKANIFEYSFEMNLGNLYHKILEDSINHEIDLNDYEDEVLNTFKTAKERFFVSLLLPQVLKVIQKNQRMDAHSKFNTKLAEKEVRLKIDDNTGIVGKIDKTLIDEEDKNIIIIDYKTGSFKFNKAKVKYGIDMQLPLYAFMMHEMYQDYTNVGVYIQNVCIDEKEEVDEPYKLEGLTLYDFAKLKRLDQEMGNFVEETGQTSLKSSFLSGIALNKDGSLSKKSMNKMLDEVSFKALIETTKEQILLANKRIRNGEFTINPILFNNDKLPCNYCPCSDICFMKNEDIRHIDLKEEGEE